MTPPHVSRPSFSTARRRGAVVLIVGLIAGMLAGGGPAPSVQAGIGEASPAHPVTTTFDAGPFATCVVESDGQIACWGAAAQLGNTNPDDSNSGLGPFARVTGITDARSVSVGVAHACVVRSGENVSCWGNNSGGQLGDGTTTTAIEPVDVVGLGPATAVAAAGGHSCAVLVTGSVNCWGNNTVGQLGNGTTTDSLLPVEATSITNAVTVSVNGRTSCALLDDGTVRCWGRGLNGALGNGVDANASSPVVVSGLTDATAITTGNLFSCALRTNGSIVCWGTNTSQQFGVSTPTMSAVPVPGAPGSFVALSAGSDHACALKLLGDLWCWGNGGSGQVGTETSFVPNKEPPPLPPTLVPLAEPALAVATGSSHSCSLSRTGWVECWGWNGSGQLGFGLTYGNELPLEVSAATATDSATSVSVGGSSVCATLANGTASCWGAVSSKDTPPQTPTIIETTNVSTVDVGAAHVCLVVPGFNPASCWGANLYGQTGSAAQPFQSDVLAVESLATAFDVSAGGSHTCAKVLAVVGTNVRCWGRNASGQLGNTSSDTHMPTTPIGLGTVVDVSAGRSHTCAVQNDGIALCWGLNKFGFTGGGQLGNGTTDNSSTAVQVAGAVTEFTKISASALHTCAATAAGAVWCWGAGGSGQLGDGNSQDSTVPVQVSGITTATDITVGNVHSCALLQDKSVTCWGHDGAVGFKQIIPSGDPTPVAVAGLAGVTSLDAGGGATCVVAAGVVKCWGANGSGQLGHPPFYTSPQQVVHDVDPLLPESIIPVVPARLLETREGLSTIDGQSEAIGIRAAQSTTTVSIAGRGGIPAGATGVIINVAAINPAAPGFLTVYPCDQPLPTASNLNYTTGINIANATTIGLDPNGDTCTYTSAATDLIVDVLAYISPQSLITTPTPTRFLDTRPGSTTIDNINQADGALSADDTYTLNLTGRPGITEGTSSVTLNIAAVNPQGNGFLTIYPCDQPLPTASTLNYSQATNIANTATLNIDTNGTTCIHTSAPTHLIADLVATTPGVEPSIPLNPARLLDTRPTGTTIDSQHQTQGPLNAEQTYVLDINGRGGLPTNPSAVTLNIAAVQPQGPGFLTIWPCDQQRPDASNINYTAGINVANTTTITPDQNGTICIYTFATTHLIADITNHNP